MKFKSMIITLSIISAVLLINCSNVMDYIEGRITKRSSFSIEAGYDPSGNIIVSWTESGGSAGTEIYMSEEPNDEFVGYMIVGGRFSGIGSSDYYQDYDNLKDPNTKSFIYPSSKISNISSKIGKGLYFFRVGFIGWDESDEQKRKDTYIGKTNWDTNTFPDFFIQQNYQIHTVLDDISGYAKVDI